jgi:hypothetical protein
LIADYKALLGPMDVVVMMTFGFDKNHDTQIKGLHLHDLA